MPTFNQLVRKGRQTAVKKSTAPALQKSFNSLRRKTMANGMAASLHMSREEALELIRQAGLDEKIRGERLSLEELAALSDAWYGKEHGEA